MLFQLKWKVDNCKKKGEVNSLFLFGFKGKIDMMMSKQGERMMEVRIRRAIKDDIPCIAKVHADSWKTTYKDIFLTRF